MTDRTVTVRFKAVVDDAVAGVRSFKGELDNLSQVKIKPQAQAIDDLAKRAAVGGLAVAAGIGMAVSAFASFDKEMSAAGAATDTTGDMMLRLRDAAIVAGRDTQFSATEAASAITSMGKAGVSAADILGGGLTGALSLAAAGQLDVGRAGEIAATAMNQFNLTGRDLPHVADLLAAGAGKAQGSVQDLATALNYVGPVAHSMGISVEESVGILAEFAQAGLVGEQGGTAFRGMLSSLLSPSELASKTMQQLGINLYDASGHFIGMAATADVLQQKLGPLDDKTRNQALGQIFGNQQLAAATVLYQGGSAAVQAWTDKVNDQGFATRQAAQLMDNLAGDIEKFSGSVETAFISAGSGGNDALRTLVQGGTDVVNILGEIPGPALLAGGALTALALVGPKAFLMFRQYRSDLDAAGLSLDRISQRAPRVGQALDVASKAAKGFGIAIAATAVASRAFGEEIDQVGTQQLTRDLLGSSDAMGVLNRTIAGATGTGTMFASNVTDLGSALRYAFDPGFLDQADQFAGSLFAAFGGNNTSDVHVAAQRLKEVDTTLAGLVQSGNGTAAASIMGQIQDAASRQGISVDELKKKFPQYAEALAAVTNQSGPAKDATKGLGDAQADAAKAAQDAADANDALLKSLSAYANLVLGARDSAREYEAAVDAGNAALKENGKTLDITTEKGRANQAALDAIASSTLGMVTHTFEARDANTALADAVGAATGQAEKGRDAFVTLATKMGLAKPEAEALADQLGLTKENVSRLSQTVEAAKLDKTGKIDVDTAQAQADIAATQGGLDKVGASRPTAVLSADGKPLDAVVESSNRKLAALDGTRPNPSLLANPTMLDATVAGSQRKLDALDAQRPDPTLSANPGPFNSTVSGAQGRLGVLDASQANPLLLAIDRASGTISTIQSGLAGLHDKSITVTTYYASVESGIRHGEGALYPAPGVRAMAAGDVLNREARIASRPILWAEAGPEAYIPIRPGNRRSEMLLAETNRLLGDPLKATAMAIGGLARVAAYPGAQPAFAAAASQRPPTVPARGPLIGEVTMVAANPREALHEMNMNLAEALAANGIDGG